MPLVPLSRQIIILFHGFSQDGGRSSSLSPFLAFLVGFKRTEQLLLDERNRKGIFSASSRILTASQCFSAVQ